MKKAIILLSGGLDSTVALWWAASKGYKLEALLFDYGQRHRKELVAAKKIAQKAGVPYQVIRLRLPWSSSSLTDTRKNVPHHSLKKIAEHKIPSTYVPGRNSIFLSYAWINFLI